MTMEPDPRLETGRLLLRRPVPDDGDAFAELLADPEVMRFIGGETVAREGVQAALERWLRRWDVNGFGPFAVERRADRQVIGRVGLIVWDRRTWVESSLAEAGDHARPELGWVFARAHWGQGYATEAAGALRTWARREQGIRWLISLIHPANIRSRRVAERLGATPGRTVKLFDSSPAVVWLHPGQQNRPDS